jgi:hypothetical protein
MGFFDSLFGGGGKKSSANPANAAMPYINQIPGATTPYLTPYAGAGQAALPQLQEQYSSLLNNPGGKLNQIGAGYQESPGLNFAIQKALGMQDRQAAASGMGGSPQNREYDTQLATNYANQDYNNYLNHALGLYGGGLSGEQGFATGGQHAAGSIADMIAQALAQQGNLAFQGQAQQNQNKNDLWGNIFKGAGSALSAFTPFSSLFGGGGLGSGMYGGG